MNWDDDHGLDIDGEGFDKIDEEIMAAEEGEDDWEGSADYPPRYDDTSLYAPTEDDYDD